MYFFQFNTYSLFDETHVFDFKILETTGWGGGHPIEKIDDVFS